MTNMRLKHNGVGLFRLNRLPTHIDTILAYRTLKSKAMVFPDPLGRVYQVEEGDMLGRRQLQSNSQSGIARKHLKVLAIDGLHTDNPTILLEVNGQGFLRNRHLKMRVYHHRLRPGDEFLPTNLVDLTRQEHPDERIGSPSTIVDGGSVRVAIGDTLELSNNIRGRSTSFSVVGLSVADQSTLNGLVSKSNRDGILDRLQFLPLIHSWFNRRGSQLERLLDPDRERQNEGNRILSHMNDNRRQTLDTLYRVIQLNPVAMQKIKHQSEGTTGMNPPSDNARFYAIRRIAAHNFEPRGERLVRAIDGPGVTSMIWAGAHTSNETMGANTECSSRRRAVEVAVNARQAYIDHQMHNPFNGTTAQWRTQPAPGLQNPKHSNMCYINSVVQLLRGMKCTRDLFLGGHFWSRHDLSSVRKFAQFGQKGGFIACALQQLFKRMQFRHARPIATGLKDSLRTNLPFANFDNDLQQDATELLGILLGVLSELLRVDGTDPISSLFCSPVISWVRCSNCGMYRDNVGDESTILHIPIIGTSIEESLRDGFFGIEQIDGWNCGNSECNSHGRKGLLLETRDILILSLKRFPDHGTKDKTLVTFPLDDLDTTPFMRDNRQTTYKLAAVINHAGDSLARGHYTMSTRFSDNTWYRYDDENVNPITASEVVTKDVYTLVYCLRNKYNELITHEETMS